jgi:hypothetical protein
MTEKYEFHKLKSKANRDDLPVDINEQIENLAKKICDFEGLESLVKYREKRWFGKVVLYDEKGRLVATAYYDHGICFRYEIISYKKNDILPLSVLSVKNERLMSDKKGSFYAEETQGR